MSIIELPSGMARGFRFHPTDEELIVDYLKPKILGTVSEVDRIIAEVDFCMFEPWELPRKSKIKSKDRVWFFFCVEKMNYKTVEKKKRNGESKGGKWNITGRRTTKEGSWKITGEERVIKDEKTKECIGKKRTLVFLKGGEKTSWVMQQYYIVPDNPLPNQKIYILCRLKKKPIDMSNNTPYSSEGKPSNDIISEVEILVTPAVVPRHSFQAYQLFTNEEDNFPEESPEEIVNRLMADSDSHMSTLSTIQFQSSHSRLSGGGLLDSDANKELQACSMHPTIAERQSGRAFAGHISEGAISHKLVGGWPIYGPDLDTEEHPEYVPAGRRRRRGAVEPQGSFSSTEIPPNEVVEEVETRNSISPSEYCLTVLVHIMILFTAGFALLLFHAWKLVQDLGRKRRFFVLLCCVVSCYVLLL